MTNILTGVRRNLSVVLICNSLTAIEVVKPCVRACVRACVHACVRACVCVNGHLFVFYPLGAVYSFS